MSTLIERMEALEKFRIKENKFWEVHSKVLDATKDLTTPGTRTKESIEQAIKVLEMVIGNLKDEITDNRIDS